MFTQFPVASAKYSCQPNREVTAETLMDWVTAGRERKQINMFITNLIMFLDTNIKQCNAVAGIHFVGEKSVKNVLYISML